MSLSRLWNRFWNNASFKYFRSGIKNINNKEFYSKKYLFQANSYGPENKGITVYNIRIYGAESGFFALIRFVLDALYLADQNGFVPFVMITNSKYNMTDGSDDNMFTYYYEQPSKVTYESLNKSYFVIDYHMDHRRWVEDCYSKEGSLLAGYEFDQELINVLAIIKKKYLHLKDDVARRLEEDISNLLEGERVLGIHFRGNAYGVGFVGHPKGLAIDDYYPYIDEALTNGFDRIFVATDDKRFLDSFRAKYADKVIYYPDTVRSDDGIDVHDHGSSLGHSNMQIGYEVLRDMMTLSRCSGFICGKSQVSTAVLIEKESCSGRFDYLKVIDKGVYSKDSKEVEGYLNKVRDIKK